MSGEKGVSIVPSFPPPSVLDVMTSVNKEKGLLYQAVLKKIRAPGGKQLPINLPVVRQRTNSFEKLGLMQRCSAQSASVYVKQSTEDGLKSKSTCNVTDEFVKDCPSSSSTSSQTSVLARRQASNSSSTNLIPPKKIRTCANDKKQTQLEITRNGEVRYTRPHDSGPSYKDSQPPASIVPGLADPPSTLPASSNSSILKNTWHMSRPALEALEKRLGEAEEVALSLLYSDRSSLLRKESSRQPRHSAVECEGVCVAVACDIEEDRQERKVEFYLLPMDSNHPEKDRWTRNQLQTILSSQKTQTLCYSAQELMTTVIEHYSLTTEAYVNWRAFDPHIAAWLLDSEHPPSSFSELLSKYKIRKSLQSVPSTSNTICSDLMQLGPLALTLYQEMQKHGLWQLFSCIETPLIPLLAGMESVGIAVDTGVLRTCKEVITKRIHEVEKQAHMTAGHTFLLTSAQQLRQVMYDELHLDRKCSRPLTRTAVQGHKSTSESVLNQLKDFHRLPSLILEYRQLLKLKSTYIDGVVPFVANGALKPNWLHTGTCTGRIASSSPNIQSFPKQEITIDEDTATSSVPTPSSLCKPKIFSVDIRNAVCSRPECMFIAADFKSIELRLLAHLSEDPDLLKVMNDPKASDIFTLLTSEWLGKKEHEVSTQERERTKRVVYGVVYGVGKERLAEILSSTSQLAKELMDGFLSKFSGVQKFIHRTIEYCQKHGHVVSLLGRKRFLPSIHSKNHMKRSHSERQAVNFVVQGSAADLCKCSMIEVAEVLCRECPKARMVLQIHDELVYELPNSCTLDLMDKVKSTLERCSLFQSLMGPLQVRIEVRMERGSTWSDLYR